MSTVIKRNAGEIPEDTSFIPDHSKPSCEECGCEDIAYTGEQDEEGINLLKCNECSHVFNESLM